MNHREVDVAKAVLTIKIIDKIQECHSKNRKKGDNNDHTPLHLPWD